MTFLVTGCGRSGTGWAAKFFTKLGYPCGHEALYNPASAGPLTANESSWLAVPHLGGLSPDVRVLRIMRDPYKVVQSAVARGFLRDMEDAYDSYVAQHRPDITEATDQLGRVIRWVALWDEPLPSATTVLRTDGSAHLKGLAAVVATGEYVNGVSEAIAALGTTTNTNVHTVESVPSRAEIDNHPDGSLMRARAERFGY